MKFKIKKRYCSKCRNIRFLWFRSLKKYVVKVTGGTGYYCMRCVLKQKRNRV